MSAFVDVTGGIDTSDATATPDKILNGYTAYGADGEKIEGTFALRTNIPTGSIYLISLIGQTINVQYVYQYTNNGVRTSYAWDGSGNLTYAPTWLLSAAASHRGKYYANVSFSIPGVKRLHIVINASMSAKCDVYSSGKYKMTYGDMNITVYSLDGSMSKKLSVSGAAGADTSIVTWKPNNATKRSDSLSFEFDTDRISFGSFSVSLGAGGSYSGDYSSYYTSCSLSYKLIEIEMEDGTIYS